MVIQGWIALETSGTLDVVQFVAEAIAQRNVTVTTRGVAGIDKSDQRVVLNFIGWPVFNSYTSIVSNGTAVMVVGVELELKDVSRGKAIKAGAPLGFTDFAYLQSWLVGRMNIKFWIVAIDDLQVVVRYVLEVIAAC